MFKRLSAVLKRRRWGRATVEEISEMVAGRGQRYAADFYGVTQATVSRRVNPPKRRSRKAVRPLRRLLPQAEQQVLTFVPFRLEQAHVEEVAKLIADGDGVDYGATVQGLAQNLCRQGSLWYDALDSDGKTVGMVGLESIQIDHGAVAHARFFDRRVRGREVAVGRFLAEVAGKLGLQVVWSFTPERHRSTPTFLKRLGFDIHGTIRRFFKTPAGLEDAVVASIARELLDERYGGASCPQVEWKWQSSPRSSGDFSPGAERSQGDSSVEAEARKLPPNPRSNPCSRNKPPTELRLVSSSSG
jgi:hypothetical protein